MKTESANSTNEEEKWVRVLNDFFDHLGLSPEDPVRMEAFRQVLALEKNASVKDFLSALSVNIAGSLTQGIK